MRAAATTRCVFPHICGGAWRGVAERGGALCAGVEPGWWAGRWGLNFAHVRAQHQVGGRVVSHLIETHVHLPRGAGSGRPRGRDRGVDAPRGGGGVERGGRGGEGRAASMPGSPDFLNSVRAAANTCAVWQVRYL